MSTHSALQDLIIEIGAVTETGRPTEWWHSDMESLPEWQGADVIITSDFGAQQPGFLGHDLVVRTRHASALTWLFLRLRDAFGDHLDSTNKYRFFGDLAKAALTHLSASISEAEDARPIMMAVLKSAVSYFRELQSNDEIAGGSSFVIHLQDSEGRQKRIDLETGEETT